MKKCLACFFMLAFLFLSVMTGLAASPSEPGLLTPTLSADTSKGQMIEVDSLIFFAELPGTFYVYFGHPACEECDTFETYLQNFLRENRQTVYYFDTEYWREGAQYDTVMKKYHVDSVPVLMRIFNTDFQAAYEFNPSDKEETVREDLQDFFGKEQSMLFPVTSENYPVQFDSRMQAFTFLLMGFSLLYLLLRKKEIIQKKLTSLLIIFSINATLLFVLHLAIAGFGFNFAIHYNANPDHGLLAWLGTRTWLTVTPVLYVAVLAVCVAWQRKIKREDKTGIIR